MIRICARQKNAFKAIRLWNDLELRGYAKHSKPYNSIIMACASNYDTAAKAIEYWHVMHKEGVDPDNRTYVAVLKACAQIGDIQTAFDVLHELKIKGGIVNTNVIN